jgi:excisionase family DNA binding protein
MDELFTIREVAEKLKISVSSVYRYVETGCFPHTKIGANIRFTQDHITAFLTENPAKAESEKANVPSQAELQAIYNQW